MTYSSYLKILGSKCSHDIFHVSYAFCYKLPMYILSYLVFTAVLEFFSSVCKGGYRDSGSLRNLATDTKRVAESELGCKSCVLTFSLLMCHLLTVVHCGSVPFFPALLHVRASYGGAMLCHVDHSFDLITHLKMASNPNIRTQTN